MKRETRTVGWIRPGHVLWMNRGATWLNRDKRRPFAVAVASPGRATLVYGSSQLTERHSGAAHVEVTPRPTGVSRNGLEMRTLFYPGTLVLVSEEALPAPAGFLGASLEALRTALRAALGIGQGSCSTPRGVPGSLRGRIVELRSEVAAHLGTSVAVVLTEHAYSAERRYQAVLPIVADPAGPLSEHDLVFGPRPWHAAFGRPVRASVVPIPIALSLWHLSEVARETEHVMDDDSLARIDRALCDYFSLPDPPGR